MRVRRLSSVGVSLVLGASLFHTSIPRGTDAPGTAARVNFRLPPADVRDIRAATDQTPVVWAFTRPLPAEGAKRSADPATREASRALPDGMPGLVLTMSVGAKAPVEVVTNALTVESLLEAMNLRLGRLDRVRPHARGPLRAGSHLRLVRIREVVRTEVVDLPYETLIQYSKDLSVGTMRLLEEGQVGRSERTYRIRYRNGQEVLRTLLKERTLSKPLNRLVLKGTYQPAPPAGAGRQVGQASWYDFCPIMGMYAAHLSIPKGTLVHVRNLDNGRSVDVVINDRGPYGVPGRIIDLCEPAFAAIAPLGQGVANVELTW